MHDVLGPIFSFSQSARRAGSRCMLMKYVHTVWAVREEEARVSGAGLFSMWACKGGGGGVPGRVLAVEPLPPNLALLRRNLHYHGLMQQACC